MNYWIFSVTSHKIGNTTLTADEIFERRMKDKFWGINEKTPNRKNLKKGDNVVFYIGLPRKEFAGCVTLSSPCIKLTDAQRKEYSHGKKFYTIEYGVLLDEIDTWSHPKSVEELVPKLKFIENKEFWFSYFQGGVRQITEDDHRIITGAREASLVEQIGISRDIESQTEFALETHLEEFISQNWDKIDWGSQLELYRSDEQDGRQFPAGTWSIDFLAVDKTKNELVVVELKRGKTSDSTVGQILRYINWVKENVAAEGQNVRGIIIAKDIDDALNYAVRDQPNIEVKTYSVNFKLFPSE